MTASRRLLPIVLVGAVAFSAASRAHAFAPLVRAGDDAHPRGKAFPGFVADVELSLNGKPAQGRVIVAADGQVYVEGLPENHRAWAADHLACLVRAPLDPPGVPGPAWACLGGTRTCFARGISQRTDDPFGFGYRVRNRQIVAVERRSRGQKLTFHLLESCVNRDQQPLPAVVVVHAWNTRTQELESTATHFGSWARVGCFDLPATIRVLEAGVHVPSSPFVELKLTNHQLLAPAAQVAADW